MTPREVEALDQRIDAQRERVGHMRRQRAEWNRNVARQALDRQRAAAAAKSLPVESNIRRLTEHTTVTQYQTIFLYTHATAIYFRASNGRIGHPLPLRVARQELRRILEDTAMPDDSDAPRYRRHVAELSERHGVAVEFVRRPGAYTNGYAWRHAARIEVPQIRGAWTYATALHEIGHVVDPESDCGARRHVRVPTREKRGSVCIPCELAAWRWVMHHACVWNVVMHENMALALETYRTYATETERRQLDVLASTTTCCAERLRRTVGGRTRAAA